MWGLTLGDPAYIFQIVCCNTILNFICWGCYATLACYVSKTASLGRVNATIVVEHIVILGSITFPKPDIKLDIIYRNCFLWSNLSLSLSLSGKWHAPFIRSAFSLRLSANHKPYVAIGIMTMYNNGDDNGREIFQRLYWNFIV